MLQTRFVCILLILILPFVTSFLNLGINRINTGERLRVIRRRQFIIQCCAGYWSCYTGPDGRLRTVTAAKAIEATTEPIKSTQTTIQEQIISSSTTLDPNVLTTSTLVQTSTTNPALSMTTSVATIAQSILSSTAVTTLNSASTTTVVNSTLTGISTTAPPFTSTITTTSTTTGTLTTTELITSSSTSTSPTTTISITSTSTATSTTTDTTTTTQSITSTSTTTTTTTSSTTPCPTSCLTSECLTANITLANTINAIPLPTLSPSSWPLQTLNGRNYYLDLSSAGYTWYAAQAECMKHGMELATIGSQAEQDAITSYIQAAGKGSSEFFIGGNKLGTQCSYVWANGEPMTYTNWNTGNPAQQTTEECMTWYGGKWCDFPCSFTKWFICEEVGGTTTTSTTSTTTTTIKTTTPCPSMCNTASCLSASGIKTAAINGVPSPTLSPSSLSLVAINGRNYYLDKSPLTWYDALAFCMKYGMTLASLGTQAESDAINSYFQSQGMSFGYVVFLSGNKLGGQCNYVWESGESMTYTNWSPVDPAQPTTEECMVWFDSKWGDLPCDWTRWFLCEQTP